MAHFAQINDSNVVTQVIVVSNDSCGGGDYPESDPIGAAFCTDLLGGTWKQTSYNGNIRKNYAGVGYTFDAERDAFIPPKPFPSWVLDEATCRWDAPVPYPQDGKTYRWDEETTSWIETEIL